jgi:hypothetical protein
MVDMVRRSDADDDDGDAGVDTDDAADRSAAVGDEAVDVAVNEVAIVTMPKLIMSGSRRTPPESTRKWTLPNVMSIPPHRPEKAERDALVCGVNSKDPKRIKFPVFGDDGAGDGGHAGEYEADTIGTADEVSCTSRFPTDDAN